MDSVAVPASLLGDIFRLLDYLDPRYGNSGQHFRKSGYGRLLVHDNALWQLWLKIKQLQHQIVETYLLSVEDVTEDEKRDLNEWIARGYSVYDNPYLISDASGSPMDFINGCRIGHDMAENPSHYFGDAAASERAGGVVDDDELPWDLGDTPF
jgi:hypothetical protein